MVIIEQNVLYKVNVDNVNVDVIKEIPIITANVGDKLEFLKNLTPEPDGQPPRISWSVGGQLPQALKFTGEDVMNGTLFADAIAVGIANITSDYKDIRTVYTVNVISAT